MWSKPSHVVFIIRVCGGHGVGPADSLHVGRFGPVHQGVAGGHLVNIMVYRSVNIIVNIMVSSRINIMVYSWVNIIVNIMV